jgi:excisionase family DNA binding protein
MTAPNHLTPELDPDVLAYSAEDAALVLPLSVHKIYDMMRAGSMRTVTVGGKRMVTRAELERVLREGDGSSSRRGLHMRRRAAAARAKASPSSSGEA